MYEYIYESFLMLERYGRPLEPFHARPPGFATSSPTALWSPCAAGRWQRCCCSSCRTLQSLERSLRICRWSPCKAFLLPSFTFFAMLVKLPAGFFTGRRFVWKLTFRLNATCISASKVTSRKVIKKIWFDNPPTFFVSKREHFAASPFRFTDWLAF